MQTTDAPEVQSAPAEVQSRPRELQSAPPKIQSGPTELQSAPPELQEAGELEIQMAPPRYCEVFCPGIGDQYVSTDINYNNNDNVNYMYTLDAQTVAQLLGNNFDNSFDLSTLEMADGQNYDLLQPQLDTFVHESSICMREVVIGESHGDVTAESHGEIHDGARGRKRQRRETEWKQSIRKRLRNSGLAYTAANGKCIERKKMMMHTCGECANKCNEKLTLEMREHIFANYWGMADYSRQRDFICSHVLQKIGKKPGKRTNLNYFFTVGHERVQVCKQVFLATLNIGERTVRYTLEHSEGAGKAHGDKRGRHAPGIKKATEQRDIVHSHIKSFPALDSHYCRARSAKKYLDATLNVSKMYDLYVEECIEKEIEPVKASYYRHIFDTEFNLSFHRPKKDFCCFCHQYENSLAEDKERLRAKYDAHQKRKQDARNAKEKYKVEAVDNKDLLVATFDLQAVLPSPKLNVSSVYYKRKLSTYNLTVYCLADHSCSCFMWHEGTAGRGSSEIASCMLKFLHDLPNDIKRVCLFSDTCSGQNRNQFFCAMIIYALHNSNIQQLDHLYMESGHSQMECDSVHANMERAVRNRDINAPTDYYSAVGTARRHPGYKVVAMDGDDFKDFKPLTKMLIRNRTKDTNKLTVNWMKIKHFRYLKERPFEIYFKYDTDTENDNFNMLHINHHSRGRRRVTIPDELPPLHKDAVKISSAKYRDLVSLCETKVIHRDYHAFYKSLSCDDGVVDCLPDTDFDDETTDVAHEAT